MFGFNRGFGHHCKKWLVIQHRPDEDGETVNFLCPEMVHLVHGFCHFLPQDFSWVSWMGHNLDFHLDLPKLPKKFKASNSWKKLGTNKFESNFSSNYLRQKLPKGGGFSRGFWGIHFDHLHGFRSRKSDPGAKPCRSLPPGPIRRRSGRFQRGARWKTPEDSHGCFQK